MSQSRSPMYPYIHLEAAIEKVNQIAKVAGKHEIDIRDLFQQLGYRNGASGSVKKIVAALNYFGLIERTEGRKKLRITRRAQQILYRPARSEERLTNLREAFFGPSIYQYCWDKWHADEVSDELMKSHLILDRGFNPSYVAKFVTNYKKSMDFVQFDGSQQIEISSTDTDDGSPSDLAPGSTVSIANGVDNTRAGQQPFDHVTVPQTTENKPDSIAGSEGDPESQELSIDMRREVFTLSDSSISIEFPSTMTKEDYEDFKNWIGILVRKVGRSIVQNQLNGSSSNTEEPSDELDES